MVKISPNFSFAEKKKRIKSLPQELGGAPTGRTHKAMCPFQDWVPKSFCLFWLLLYNFTYEGQILLNSKSFCECIFFLKVSTLFSYCRHGFCREILCNSYSCFFICIVAHPALPWLLSRLSQLYFSSFYHHFKCFFCPSVYSPQYYY